MHHVVEHQRHRLRSIEAEIGIAVTANIKARERAAEGGFDIQAGDPPAQCAHILAAGVDDIELLAAKRGNGVRHIFDIFGTALCGNGNWVQLANFLGGLGVLREHAADRQAGSNDQAEDTGARRGAESRNRQCGRVFFGHGLLLSVVHSGLAIAKREKRHTGKNFCDRSAPVTRLPPRARFVAIVLPSRVFWNFPELCLP